MSINVTISEEMLYNLKAKADLLDEMREQLGKSTIVISTNLNCNGSGLIKHNQDLLFKAEELSK